MLVVDDERHIVDLVGMGLEGRGMEVKGALDGDDALRELEEFRPDAVVLDLMLSGLSGFELCRRVRMSSNVPILVLSARNELEDKVSGLNLGADDYLTKPFDIEELLARIRALLRRAVGDEILRVADLEVNTTTHEVRRGDRQIELTFREYELLEFMARNPRRVLSRDLLLSRVWDQDGELTTNLVDVYVGYLRKKVDAPGEESLIRTVRGAGYALKEG